MLLSLSDPSAACPRFNLFLLPECTVAREESKSEPAGKSWAAEIRLSGKQLLNPQAIAQDQSSCSKTAELVEDPGTAFDNKEMRNASCTLNNRSSLK